MYACDVRMSAFVFVCTYTYVYMYVYLYMYVYTSISMSVCMHACLYMRMHAYMYMYMYHEHATSSHIRMRLCMISERLWPKPRPSPPPKTSFGGYFFERRQKSKMSVSYTRDARTEVYGGFVFALFFKNSLLVYTKRSLLSLRPRFKKKLRIFFKNTEFFFHKVCKGCQKEETSVFRGRSGYYNNRNGLEKRSFFFAANLL